MWRTALKVFVRAAAPLAFGGVAQCAATTTSPQNVDAPLSTSFPHGLTRPGVTHKFYATQLDLDRPLLLRGSGDFMAAARADARERLGLGAEGSGAPPSPPPLSEQQRSALEESVRLHIVSAARACSAFLRSGAVHDREEITAALVEGVFKRQGQLALLLGGKSVGKSHLLAGLAARSDIVGSDGAVRAVLYVDARQFSKNLAAGLEAALLGESQELEGWLAWLSAGGRSLRRPQGSRPEAVAPPPISSASLTASLRAIGLEAKVNFGDKATVMEANVEMLARVVALAEKRGLYICLVVDEANLALPTPPPMTLGGSGPGQQHQPPLPPEEQRMLADTRLLLERLVQLTKQTRRMNALLVTSEYAYPYRLQHNGFFNTTNLTRTLFAGEVPPGDMRALLQGAWGLGPRLSDVFLGYYGGHVHMASQALALLEEQGDQFKCEDVAPASVRGAIVRCLEAGEAGGRGSMREMLRAMAQQGFAPVRHEGDTRVQALSEANIGGLVVTSATVVGLPEGLREGSEFGCVPSSNFIVRHPHSFLHLQRAPSPPTHNTHPNHCPPHTSHHTSTHVTICTAPRDCQGAIHCCCTRR